MLCVSENLLARRFIRFSQEATRDRSTEEALAVFGSPQKERYMGSVPPASTPLRVKWIPDGASRQRVVGSMRFYSITGVKYRWAA